MAQGTAPTAPVASPDPAPATPSRPRRRRGCLWVFLILLVLVAAIGAGGYLLVSSGQVSLMALQAQLNGVGSVSVVNIADARLTVRLVSQDPEEGETTTTRRLDPFDIDGFGGLAPAHYRVIFEAADGAPAAATCALQLSRGDDYQFVAVPEGIVVTLGDGSAASADELDVATSRLCRAGDG